MANIPQLDAEQEQKVRDYLDGFEDWGRISAVNERVVKQTNLIPPVYIALIGSDAIRDNGLISTVSKFAIQYDSKQLVRGGAVEYGPHIGELESVFLTVFGRRLRVDMELGSHTRGEYNEE
ncbi:hypothetical protein DOTSEDRAFT_29596 [Dothistroma septosporum NZE10]|uniref:Uncharacterized protein n=1 Tax=Dothistroma septosporum (strain NZE10 / CBS 128990) TaxID=675120 RepID=N1PCJ3_DOTSN|nr:hypothetical protein DOTSEDRAFT_29596 [Dothistroma septosporum NZE10]